MTTAEWLVVKVGDFVVDRGCASLPHREVLAVKRVSGKLGQRGKTRTTIHVPRRHGKGPPVIICNTEDRSGARFVLRLAP